MRKLRLNQTLMSVPGHLRPTHSAPVPTFVRCYSNSDRFLRRSEMTLSANSGHASEFQVASYTRTHGWLLLPEIGLPSRATRAL